MGNGWSCSVGAVSGYWKEGFSGAAKGAAKGAQQSLLIKTIEKTDPNLSKNIPVKYRVIQYLAADLYSL